CSSRRCVGKARAWPAAEDCGRSYDGGCNSEAWTRASAENDIGSGPSRKARSWTAAEDRSSGSGRWSSPRTRSSTEKSDWRTCGSGDKAWTGQTTEIPRFNIGGPGSSARTRTSEKVVTDFFRTNILISGAPNPARLLIIRKYGPGLAHV